MSWEENGKLNNRQTSLRLDDQARWQQVGGARPLIHPTSQQDVTMVR